MQLPKVSVFLGVSLDGYIAGENGDLSWLSVCAGESTAESGYDALMSSVDTLLIGRTTYDIACGFEPWPYAGKRVVVASHHKTESRHGESFRQGDIRQILKALHEEGARHVYLDGGSLVSQAVDQALVSEMTLSHVPVVLGKGVKLFQGERGRSHWRLLKARPFQSGMVQCSYMPVATV